MDASIEKKAEKAAWNFFTIKEEFDKRQKEFEEQKKSFYETMSEYFSNNGSSSIKFRNESGFGQLSIKKIDKSLIEWDVEKLEKRIGKSIAKQIIKKKYYISDMYGLTTYLKSCGVDPKIFKRFIVVEKTVDENAVDRLGDTGMLSVDQITGCYSVKSQKPYYTASFTDG